MIVVVVVEMTMTRVYIDKEVEDLLQYIVTYRKLRGKANKRIVVNELIIEYAKKLTTGMPEAVWRESTIELINAAEKRK